MTKVATETGVFARELYEFLRLLDRTPGADALDGLRNRIDRLLRQCRRLVDRALGDEAVSAVVRALRSLLGALEDLGHRLAEGWSPAAFASFRSAAAPHYEALAARLRALSVPAPTLRPQNLTRSAYHVANGLLATAFIALLPWWAVQLAAGAFFTTAVTMEIGRRRSPAWNRFAMRLFKSVAHPSEEFRVNSATFYATALFSIALFSGPLPALLAVLALGLGDPAAAFVGRRWGKVRIHAGRSLEGSLAFTVVAASACFGILAWLHPELAPGLRLALALAAGTVGAVVELFSGRIDDNLSIPLGVAISAHVVLALAS